MTSLGARILIFWWKVDVIAAIECIQGHPRMALYGKTDVSTKNSASAHTAFVTTSKVSCPVVWVALPLKSTKIVEDGSNLW